MQRVNQAGLDIIKEFEGLRLQTYTCAGGKKTIGWGSTKGVTDGMHITMEEANERLLRDVWTAEKAVNDLVKVKLTSNEFSALVSLVFNIGAGNFKKSTLLAYLNKGWYNEASKQFMRWNKAGGVELGGLNRRRAREALLFNQKENDNDGMDQGPRG